MKLANSKVLSEIKNLRSSLDRKNARLVNKYISQLADCNDNLMLVQIEAETEENKGEQFMLNATSSIEKANSIMLEANEFLFELEETQVSASLEKVKLIKFNDLKSSLQYFIDDFDVSPEVLVEKLEESQRVSAVNANILEKKSQLEKLYATKLEIESQHDGKEFGEVEDLLAKARKSLDKWIVQAQKVRGLEERVCQNVKESAKKPGLKLDRLALPVFRGSVRNYARFLMEFESTVGAQFPDPKIKLLYLKNQCLSGSPKELVRNLTDFDEVISRLNERYGRVSIIIDTVLRDVKELKLNADEPLAIITLARCLEVAWDDLSAIDAVDEFCNVITLRTIEGKLPLRLQTLWAQEKSEADYSSSKAAMQSLRKFTEKHRKVASEVLTMRGKGAEGSVKSFKDKVAPNVKVVSQTQPTPIQGCFRCGYRSHRVKDCKVPSTITCRKCKKVGHIENACQGPVNGNVEKKVKFGEEPDVDQNSNMNVKSAIRLPIEEVLTDYGPCTVLWDTGSMLNLVSHDWALDNELEGKECSLEFKVVDDSIKHVQTQVYQIPLISRNGVKKFIKAYELQSLAAGVKRLNCKLLKNILDSENIPVDIDEIGNPEGKIQLLLGSECISDFPVVKHKVGELCIMSSEYGIYEYVVAGFHDLIKESSCVNIVCHAESVRVTPLHEVCDNVVAQVQETRKDKLLKDFLSVEELGVRPPPICKTCKSCQICKPASQFLSLKDYREMNVIKSKLSYDSQCQCWRASYPFVKDPGVLTDNYDSAYRALKRREKKLLKEEKLKQSYNDQVLDFVNRGVLRKLTDVELQDWHGPVRYVDHHEVFKVGSTTPLRIVINSSFCDKGEPSLNDILMKGPNVLTNLFEILVRWRIYPIAFTGDISKMYHNVRTGELEGHLRRFLWRDCQQDRDPDIFCFDTVTFGDRPAGCIAVSALRATADMFSCEYEQAAEVIKNDTYMDDVASGDFVLHDAKILSSKIEGIAAKGGFKFKGFVFSFEIDEEKGEKFPLSKVLGVTWNSSDDKICVVVDLNHNRGKRGLKAPAVTIEEIPYTKRVCLRLVNGIFYPLGLVSPVTVRLKLLMREHFVLQSKYKKWDTPLELADRSEWIKVLRDVLEVNHINIPRHCFHSPNPVVNRDGVYTLVCFADASMNAMCAAVYLRFEAVSGEVSTGLLTSKTKVAPAKSASIPRLELCASLLGSRLSNKVISAVSLSAHVLQKSKGQRGISFDAEYILLDSQVALGTLNKGSLANDFTGNCVAEVRGKSPNAVFAWLHSEDNISDLGTRGAKPEMVCESSEWQRGPSWLCDPVDSWPIEVWSLSELPMVNVVEVNTPIIEADKFSCLKKLHKVTALCLKFVMSKGNGKGKLDNNWQKVKLSPEDFKRAELYWLKVVSASVVTMYEAGKLQSLRPETVWDAEGKFLKVITSGRLGKLLKIGYDVEELPILDPKHPYTRLVLKDYHELDHSGDDRTVWKSRVKFWIPQARRIVRNIRKECYRCKLLTKKNVQQLMAPLPDTRVLPTPVWTNTSIDLFGPLEHVDMVKKRMKEKCWGIIFTCMVSRAVHLDLTQAYHTDAVLQALRRFFSLRGCPKLLLSDQGSQLVACSKEVAGMLELLDWNMVQGWCSRKGVEWKMVPPQGQHMNGVTESLIRSTKHLLKQSLEGRRLNFVEMQTVLYEIAQIMNCRPLGIYHRPGTDPLDGGPITPNHLLLGRATSAIPELKFENVTHVKRMKFAQETVEEFWTKWRQVVFHSLVPQFKWHKAHRNVAVGDVVLLNDDLAKVGEFRLGQVVGVKTSDKDGLIRSVEVRCVSRSDGKASFCYLSRPVHKLCVIVPVEEQ